LKKRTGIVLIALAIVIAVAAIIYYLKSKKNTAAEVAAAAAEPENAPLENRPFVPGTGKTRALRNNNPFNLRISGSAWKGKVPRPLNTDGSFEQFYELKWGVRAGLKNMINKVNRSGLTTLSSLIPVLTPPNENNTGKYIQDISQITGIAPSSPLTMDRSTATSLGHAIARLEGATLPKSAIDQGFDLL
jgi:hypothetical protein